MLRLREHLLPQAAQLRLFFLLHLLLLSSLAILLFLQLQHWWLQTLHFCTNTAKIFSGTQSLIKNIILIFFLGIPTTAHACVRACVCARTIPECCNTVVSLLEELGGFIQLLLWRLQMRVQLLHLTVSKKTDTVKMLLWLHVTRVLLQVITDTVDGEASLWSHKRTCVCNLSLCCCVLSRALATSVLSMSCLTSSSWWKTAQKLQIANQLTCILLLAVKKYINV